MTHAQIIEKRNKLMADAGALAQSKDANAETRTKVKAMLADVDILNDDAAVAQRLETHAEELRTSTRPPRGEIATAAGDAVAKEKRAFTNWMRTGQIASEDRSTLKVETRDLGVSTPTGVITGGNVLVPVGFDPQLHVAQKSYGAIVGAVRQLVTSGGNPIRVALADDTANSMTVIGEAVAVSEVDPLVSGFTSYTDELTTGLVKVSNSLLQDSAFDVDAFIQNTFAARYYKGLAKMITLGNGSNIQAITTGTAIQNATGGTTSVTYAELVALYGALDPAYMEASSWVMSSTTRANLMGLTNTTGTPLLQADVNGVPFNSIFGRPIVISQFAQAMTAGKFPILFGDLTQYTLRSVAGGLRVARLVERFAEMDEVGFIGYSRNGGYNTSQSTSPSIVSLEMAAA